MFFDMNTTLQDIVNRMGKWLKVQRTAANCYAELPTVTAVYYKFDVEMNNLIEKCLDRYIRDEFYEHKSWEVEPYIGQDIWVRTLCFIALEGETLQVSCWFGGEKRVMLAFPLTCKNFVDGDDKCRAVVAIGLPEGADGETTLCSVLSKVAWEQHGLEPDAIKRWTEAPESFRSYHPICPVCGAKVRIGEFGDPNSKSVRRMVCDSCDWQSAKQYQHGNEDLFTGKKGFSAELNFVRKAQKTESETKTAVAAIDEQLQKLVSMWKSKKYAMTDDDFKRTMAKIAAMVEKAKQARKTER